VLAWRGVLRAVPLDGQRPLLTVHAVWHPLAESGAEQAHGRHYQALSEAAVAGGVGSVSRTVRRASSLNRFED